MSKKTVESNPGLVDPTFLYPALSVPGMPGKLDGTAAEQTVATPPANDEYWTDASSEKLGNPPSAALKNSVTPAPEEASATAAPVVKRTDCGGFTHVCSDNPVAPTPIVADDFFQSAIEDDEFFCPSAMHASDSPVAYSLRDDFLDRRASTVEAKPMLGKLYEDFVLDVGERGDAPTEFTLAHQAYEAALKSKREAGAEFKRNKCALLRRTRDLRAWADEREESFSLIILQLTGRKTQSAYNYEHALQFAERAKLLEENEDGTQLPGIPDISAMAAAESAFSAHNATKAHIPALQARLIKEARETGRLPSVRSIEREIKGTNRLCVKLDCRLRHYDPDIGEDDMGRIVMRGVMQILRELAGAGSEVAKQQHDAIDKRVREEEAKRDENIRSSDYLCDPDAVYAKVPIEIFAKIVFKPDIGETGRLKAIQVRSEQSRQRMIEDSAKGSRKRKIEAMQRNFAKHEGKIYDKNGDWHWK